MESRVTRTNVADVALEVLYIDWIETNDGGIETDVGFGDVFAIVEWSW